MNKAVANFLGHDGMRIVRIIGDKEISQERYLALAGVEARSLVMFKPAVDELLDIHSLEMNWPIYGPFEIAIHGPKKFRSLMFVHFSLASPVG